MQGPVSLDCNHGAVLPNRGGTSYKGVVMSEGRWRCPPITPSCGWSVISSSDRWSVGEASDEVRVARFIAYQKGGHAQSAPGKFRALAGCSCSRGRRAENRIGTAIVCLLVATVSPGSAA
jgi:hypothetical protein